MYVFISHIHMNWCELKTDSIEVHVSGKQKTIVSKRTIHHVVVINNKNRNTME